MASSKKERGGRRARARTTAPMPPPTPAVVGQGLAVWLGFQVFKKSKRPLHWVMRNLRDALFGWKDYTKYLREQTVVEGLFNGRKAWLALGAVMWGARALRRTAGRTEQIVLQEALQAGDQLIITQVPRKPSRAQRKAASSS